METTHISTVWPVAIQRLSTTDTLTTSTMATLHSLHDGHVDEHRLEVNASNPADCSGGHDCAGHNATHQHGNNCGHEAVPHGDHVDYLVDGHLHHPHDGHCDNHGKVQRAN